MQGVTSSVSFGALPVAYSLTPLSGWGDERVADTVAVMNRYAVEDAATPEIQQDAQEALALGGGDPLLGVWKLAKGRVRFQQDADTAAGTVGVQQDGVDIVEVVIRPVDLSRMYRRGLQPVEDCDGFSGYVAAMLTALGVPCAFCTVAVDPTDSSQYSHVYVVAYPQTGGRVAIDASHGEFCGWECPNPFGKRREWPVGKVGLTGLLVLAGVLAGLVYVANQVKAWR